MKLAKKSKGNASISKNSKHVDSYCDNYSLPEYLNAYMSFIAHALNLLVKAQSPFLSYIDNEKLRNALPETFTASVAKILGKNDEILSVEPTNFSVNIGFAEVDVLNARYQLLIEHISEELSIVVRQFEETHTRSILEQGAAAVIREDRFWEQILDFMEQHNIGIDENGLPSFKGMALIGDGELDWTRTIARTEEQEERYQLILSNQRDELAKSRMKERQLKLIKENQGENFSETKALLEVPAWLDQFGLPEYSRTHDLLIKEFGHYETMKISILAAYFHVYTLFGLSGAVSTDSQSGILIDTRQTQIYVDKAIDLDHVLSGNYSHCEARVKEHVLDAGAQLIRQTEQKFLELYRFNALAASEHELLSWEESWEKYLKWLEQAVLEFDNLGTLKPAVFAANMPQNAAITNTQREKLQEILNTKRTKNDAKRSGN